MKGKHVSTSHYASEVFDPTGRNVDDEETVICLNCDLDECIEEQTKGADYRRYKGLCPLLKARADKRKARLKKCKGASV